MRKKLPEIKRKFETIGINNETIELGIIVPSQKVLQEAAFQYSKAFSKGLREGLLTNAEAEKIVKERGLWGAEKLKEIAEIEEEIDLKERILVDKEKEKLSDNVALEIAYELATLRDKKFNLQRPIQSIYNNTAESRAEEIRIEFLTSNCIINPKDNKIFFKNHDDFLDMADGPAARESVYQLMTFMNGLDANFLEKLPEAPYIKKEQEKILKKLEEDTKKLEKKIKSEEKKQG